MTIKLLHTFVYAEGGVNSTQILLSHACRVNPGIPPRLYDAEAIIKRTEEDLRFLICVI